MSRKSRSGIEPRLLSVDQVAQYLSLGSTTVREMIAKRIIPTVPIPNRVLVDREDLDAYIDSLKAVKE